MKKKNKSPQGNKIKKKQAFSPFLLFISLFIPNVSFLNYIRKFELLIQTLIFHNFPYFSFGDQEVKENYYELI